jgi:hypothetical protein
MCGFSALWRDLIHVGERTKVEVIGIKMVGALAPHTSDLGPTKSRFDCAYDTLCDLILEVEDISA